MKPILSLLAVASGLFVHANASPLGSQVVLGNANGTDPCFPSLAYKPRDPKSGPPNKKLEEHWCSQESENGFFGFTYATWGCPSLTQMQSDFGRMRNQFKARYVRMYGWCEDGDFLTRITNAAFSQGVGLHGTIWFGFDGGDAWKKRRDQFFALFKSNPLAAYTFRTLDVGSEPLFDWVLPPKALALEILSVKKTLAPYGIKVSISEMQYGYSVQGDSQMVLDAEDVVHAHQLQFFDKDATTGDKALPSILSSTNWFVSKTNKTRKIIYSQTGWPTNAKVWKPNSPKAVASVQSAKGFYQVLDSSCEQFKKITPLGGVGWFWHIWKDDMLDGWGLIDWNGNPKWNFAPRTSC